MTLIWRPGYTWNETIWNPSMLQTALWLDAADAATVTTVSNAVSQWNDKSGNHRHPVQSVAELRPTYVTSSLNGKNGVDWGAAINGKGLEISSTFASATVIAVADYDGNNPFDEFSAIYSASSAPTFYRPIFTSNTGTGWLASSTCALNGALTGSNTALPTISSPFIVRNVSVSSTSNHTAAVIGNDSPILQGRGWRGKIYELIALSSVPSTADRQKVEGYLAHKWGLTANLPVDHPYKLLGPAP